MALSRPAAVFADGAQLPDSASTTHDSPATSPQPIALLSLQIRIMSSGRCINLNLLWHILHYIRETRNAASIRTIQDLQSEFRDSAG